MFALVESLIGANGCVTSGSVLDAALGLLPCNGALMGNVGCDICGAAPCANRIFPAANRISMRAGRAIEVTLCTADLLRLWICCDLAGIPNPAVGMTG